MAGDIPLVVFGRVGQQYALPLDAVERVVRAVELTPLPGAPAAIRGMFSLHGLIIPVGDFRRRFGLEEQPLSIHDHIVIARSPRRRLGILAEGKLEVLSVAAEDVVQTEAVVRGAAVIAGIARLPNGLVLIQDLARFLTLEEEPAVEQALTDVEKGGYAPF